MSKQSPHSATKCQTLTPSNGRSAPGDVQRASFARGAHGKAKRDWSLLTIDLSDVCLIVMARGTLRLSEALKDEKTVAPINMILRDPLRYGLRLWREYNMRARPIEFREIASPLDLSKTQDIGDEWGGDEWGVGMDPSDGWGSPPRDLDWSATQLKELTLEGHPSVIFGKTLDVSGALSLFLPFRELLVEEVFSMNAANALLDACTIYINILVQR